MVGITTLVFYSIVKSRATKTLAEAEAAVHSIADRIRGVDEDVVEKAAEDETSKFA
jgi:biopolymer transport protein ExbB/TolQ